MIPCPLALGMTNHQPTLTLTLSIYRWPPPSSPPSTSLSRPIHLSRSLSFSLCFDWFLFTCQHDIIPPHNSPKPLQPQPSLENRIQEKKLFTDRSSQDLATDKPNLMGFFCVFLVGFSDLLILFMGLQFLGFVRFFVQLGLLDLGICLDGKKMLWLFLFIFGFITCILCYFGFVDRKSVV